MFEHARMQADEELAAWYSPIEDRQEYGAAAAREWTRDVMSVGCQRGAEPISELTARDLTLSTGAVTRRARDCVARLPPARALGEQLACEGYECNNARHDCPNSHVLELERETGFTHCTKHRDDDNARFWQLQTFKEHRGVRDREGVGRLLQREVAVNNSCASDPYLTYAGSTIPLFVDNDVDSTRLGEGAGSSFAYRAHTGKEYQGQFLQSVSYGKAPQGGPTMQEFGQFTRNIDPTKRVCRSDFASNLGPMA